MGFCNSTHFSALPRPAAVSGDPAIANCGLAAYAADLRSERLRVCEVNRFSLSTPPPPPSVFSSLARVRKAWSHAHSYAIGTHVSAGDITRTHKGLLTLTNCFHFL